MFQGQMNDQEWASMCAHLSFHAPFEYSSKKKSMPNHDGSLRPESYQTIKWKGGVVPPLFSEAWNLVCLVIRYLPF